MYIYQTGLHVKELSGGIFWWSVLPLWVTKINSTKIGQPYICQPTKENFDSSNKANLGVFQNHRIQAKINLTFFAHETADWW